MKRNVAFILAVLILVLSCGFVAVFDIMCTAQPGDIVKIDEHLVEIEDPLNKSMLDYASKLFSKVHDENFPDSNCYFVLIPDKYRYLTDKQYEYDEFYDYLESELSFCKFIPVYDLLCADDYYRTDPHIKQDCFLDVSQRVLGNMGKKSDAEFTTVSVSTPFIGNYAHRSNKKVESDSLFYLQADYIKSFWFDEKVKTYDAEKLTTDEPYEFFLSGNQPVVTIENKMAKNEDRLIIFRDSFACSAAPIIAQDYSQVVLVDLRYIMSDHLTQYVDFENADVLFMYSTTLMNNSLTMR